MKILEQITLVIFSILVLVIAIILMLLLTGFVSINAISTIYTKLIANQVATNITIGISAICVLLAVKAIFFGDSSNGSSKMNGDGVLLENESGRLLISRETIENLVNSVAKGFENTQSVTTKVIVDSDNSLKVFVTLMVLPNTVISELSMNLQKRIKEVVKNVTDLDIRSIDIKIKNITTPEENKEA